MVRQKCQGIRQMRSFADEHEPVAHEETADNTVLPCILLRIGLKIRLIHMDANLIFRVKLKVNKKQYFIFVF
ncbi:hypothetical protein VIGAN_08203200 [Vigna angularis var. angularis]|uniref:Uncharacterized protein n=1 Tax=Vigna angularis var. angularis TaxID=157739 RepID=A0A0S3SR61_PHAAN|nr:hypothetical protein VIGAN_08203200 [Vigna angularis var. angularis]